MFIRLATVLAIISCGLSAQSIVVVGSPSALVGVRKVTTTDQATTADYTILADATAGAFTETVPTTPYKGEVLNVKKVDATVNAVTISGNGANIDGSTTVIISVQYTSIHIQYDGTQWWVL